MAATAALGSQNGVSAVEFYTPELHELVDCREEFYSPTEAVLFIDFSLPKVQEVFNRMLVSAQKVGKERSEEFNHHVVKVSHRTFMCQLDLNKPTNRLPGDASLVSRSNPGEKPLVYWQLCLVRSLAANTNPDYASLKTLVTTTYQPSPERPLSRHFCSFFKPEDLKPTQRPYTSSGKIERGPLPDDVLDLVLCYAITTPGSEELFETTRKKIPNGFKRYTESVQITFNYPLIAERLREIANVCCELGRDSLANALLAKAANTTYHLMERNVRRENVNADRFIAPGEAHWDMNLSLKVDAATVPQCTNPAILKIYFLFLRHKVEPKKGEVVELSKQESTTVSAYTPIPAPGTFWLEGDIPVTDQS